MGMTRREFLKNAAMAVAAGAMMQPDKLLAPKKAEANEPGSPKNILNYNPNMQYRPMGRTGVDVSALGFGMLRLPMLADGKTVDMDQTVRMVRRAIEGGVNYIDTGYVYLGGQSQMAKRWRADCATACMLPIKRRGGLWNAPKILSGCLTNRARR